MVKAIVRLEGLAVFLTSVLFYFLIDGNFFLFILLLFIPDISMIGYLRDKKLGSIAYNLMHNYVLALIGICLGALLAVPIFVYLGLILLAHVGIDRFFGFGLKYGSSFKATHIQKV